MTSTRRRCPAARSRPGCLDLGSGAATLIACIPKGVTVDTDPWTGSFSPDGTMYATSSGNSETGVVQLLVFDVQSGKLLLQTSLPGVKQALHVSPDAPFVNVWSLSFA